MGYSATFFSYASFHIQEVFIEHIFVIIHVVRLYLQRKQLDLYHQISFVDILLDLSFCAEMSSVM